jgi:methylmalonyl-CoA mutase N-terminal domain/subunit
MRGHRSTLVKNERAAKKNVKELIHENEKWDEEVVRAAIETVGERKPVFRTTSGIPVERVYTPVDLLAKNFDYLKDLNFPGVFPYTRGKTSTMYRSNLWVFGQYAGFGTAGEANKRYKYLISKGYTGLSVALDLPTQVGLDSDHNLAGGGWEDRCSD